MRAVMDTTNADAPAVTTPPQMKSDEGLKGGKDRIVAERVARTQACTAEPQASLVAKGPGFEAYSIACSNGDALAIRCEFGNCRVLR